MGVFTPGFNKAARFRSTLEEGEGTSQVTIRKERAKAWRQGGEGSVAGAECGAGGEECGPG